jgi:hypothetical protein
MIDPKGFVYFEPKVWPVAADVPLIDDLTRKVAFLFRQCSIGTSVYRGWHTCVCSAKSDNKDYFLPDGRLTHSLCVHYVACHRDEMSREILADIVASTLGMPPVEPTPKELKGSQ